jgi:hypothetical protein
VTLLSAASTIPSGPLNAIPKDMDLLLHLVPNQALLL